MIATDSAAFLSAIIANPGDDSLRLVYADWLEEHDQQERAQFIRVQCATGYQPDWLDARGAMTWEQRVHQNLLPGWKLCGWDCDPPWVVYQPEPLETFRFQLRRGFVAEVRCKAEDWRKHGPALVRAQPIETVRLSNCTPFPVRLVPGYPHIYTGVNVGPKPLYLFCQKHPRHMGRSTQDRLNDYWLPPDLFGQLRGGRNRDPSGIAVPAVDYPTEAKALAALSDAALRLARSLPV